MAQALAGTAERQPQKVIRVWDAFVRLFHWSVAVGFFVAYFTEDGPLTLHVWAGYVVGVLVVLRIVWGFMGPEHARFSSFILPPGTVLRYLWELLLGRAKRYLGQQEVWSDTCGKPVPPGGAGPALERAAHIGGDPAAVKIAFLRFDPLVSDVAGANSPGIKRHVVDRMISRLTRRTEGIDDARRFDQLPKLN